jgi:hypothetical protein
MDKKKQAKYEALNEAADHLDLAWTDDSDEREAGQKLSTRLRREAERLKEIGDGTAGDATGEPFFIKSRV